ncbi:MAG TPA: DNA polymerase III subunit beta [candidate division Zixibacteria bacterium]
MKFSILKSKLFDSIQKTLNAVPGKTPLPILSNFLLEFEETKLKISATDLDVSITTSIPIKSTKKGSLVIPARTFTDIIREAPETEIEINITDERLEMRIDKGSYKISGSSSEEYPKIPSIQVAKEINIPGETLVRMIKKVGFAASMDETRPALSGILWQTSGEVMCMAATDGHRLAKVALQNTKLKGLHKDIIIPPKALNLLVKLYQGDEELGVIFGENNIIFNLGDVVLSSRLIEGPYPDYEQVIPKDNDKKLIVNKELLASLVRRVSVLSNTLTHQIKFSLKKDSLELSATNAEVGGEAIETLPCNYKNEIMEIGYNANYILDILKQVDGDEVVFELATPVSAGMVHSASKEKGEEYLCLIMPLRLNE